MDHYHIDSPMSSGGGWLSLLNMNIKTNEGQSEVHTHSPQIRSTAGRRGHWDSTNAAAALLLTACMIDIVSDNLSHMTFCMGKMTFFLVKILFVNKI